MHECRLANDVCPNFASDQALTTPKLNKGALDKAAIMKSTDETLTIYNM